MNLPAIPASLATGAGALLSGAPWWAIILCATVIMLVPPVVAQARAWSKDKADRKYQSEFLVTVNQLADPEKKIQAMIEYRRLVAGGAIESGQELPAGPGPQSTPADPQGP